MIIKEQLNGTVLTLELNGTLDTNTYSILDDTVSKYINDITRINLNLKELRYISSAGLRVILAIHKNLSKKEGLYIYNVNEEVKEIFDITGFLSILNIE